MQSVSQFVQLGSTSNVFNANFKFDAWLLPFLDVYALAGYVHNTSTTDALVSVPKPGQRPGTIEYQTEVTTELDGVVAGGGVALVRASDPAKPSPVIPFGPGRPFAKIIALKTLCAPAGQGGMLTPLNQRTVSGITVAPRASAVHRQSRAICGVRRSLLLE